MKKAALAIGAVGLVLAAWLIGPALASSLTDTSTTEGAGNTAISRCDTGVTTTLNNSLTTPFPIATVTVSGLASGCAGLTLTLTVRNNLAVSSSGSGTVPGGGGSMTITLASTVAETDTMQTEIEVT